MSGKTVGFDGNFYVTNSIDSKTGYTISNQPVLTQGALGPSIVSSNLTSLGSLVNLNVMGDTNLKTLNSVNLNAVNINTTNTNSISGTISNIYSDTISANSSIIPFLSSQSSTTSSLYTDTILCNTFNNTNLITKSGSMSSIFLNSATCGSIHSTSLTSNNININSAITSSLTSSNITSNIYYGYSQTITINSTNSVIVGALGYTGTLYIDCAQLSLFAIYIVYFRGGILTLLSGSPTFQNFINVSITPANTIVIKTVNASASYTIVYNLIINNISN